MSIKTTLRCSLFVALFGVAAPSAAIAQDAPVDEAPPAEVEATAAEADAVTEDEGEVIVITGTAIARKETTTPAPVAIVNKAELQAAGVQSIGEVLQNLPSQSNAINVQFNNGGDGSTRISLRGLGAGRTLVLVNGRRHVPGGTGVNSSVDLNAIPMAIVERVEVLKDGASAVYGSDAIGGVVNIITRQNFDGTEANVYTGTTGQGDGVVYDVNVVSGVTSDKGSFLFSAGFYDQGDIMAGDRDFSKLDKYYDFDCVAAGGPATLYHPDSNPDGCIYPNGSSATPEGTIIDYGEATSPEWDAVLAGDCPSGVCFLDASGIRDMNFNGNSDDGTGDLYNYQPENYLLTPQRRYNFYSQGRWHLTEKVDAFFESSYMRRKSSQLLAPEPLFTVSEGIVVSADNQYNVYNRDFIDVRRRMVEASNRMYRQDVETFRLVGGVDGELPGNWRWSANYNFGRTVATDVNEGNFVLSRVENALGPSFRDADGVWHCGTPDAPIADCVPLNLFGGPGSISQAMLDYIQYTGITRGYTMQNSVQANASGKLADTPWGGHVGLAVGAEYRRMRGEYLPTPHVALGDTTGNKSDPTAGMYDVYEGYGELSVVPVTDAPMAKWVELSAAVRGFRYNTFGSGATWKTGALWRAPAGVAVRGTFSTAFRAPTIGELYGGQADSFPNITDPCDTSVGPRTPQADAACRAEGIPDDFTDIRTQLKTLVGGNPDAGRETANTFTAGAVYEPPAVPGLAFTLDYFWVKVDDAIQTVGGGLILSQCYQNGDPDACAKITRDSTSNLITVIDDRITNIGGNKTAGIDWQVRYDWRNDFGRFRHNLEGTWLHKFNDIQPSGQIIEGKGIYDLGVYPAWKANFATVWGKDGIGAGVNVRYIGSIKECKDDDCETFLSDDNTDMDPTMSRDVDANITADIFASYDLKTPAGNSALTVGINNVMDQDPPKIYNGFLGTSDASTYDYMGRYFYVRFMQSY